MAPGFRLLSISYTVPHRSIAGINLTGCLNIRCANSVYIDDVGFKQTLVMALRHEKKKEKPFKNTVPWIDVSPLTV